MTRKADIMFALEQLDKAKICMKEGLHNSAILRVNLALEWIHKALDIAPTDAAIEEVRNDAP
jgi:hypothetical protein